MLHGIIWEEGVYDPTSQGMVMLYTDVHMTTPYSAPRGGHLLYPDHRVQMMKHRPCLLGVPRASVDAGRVHNDRGLSYSMALVLLRSTTSTIAFFEL